MTKRGDFVPFPEEVAELYRREGLWIGETLGAFLENRVERFSRATAVIDGPNRLTYAELGLLAARCSNLYANLGLVRGDRLVLQLPNDVGFLAALFGAFLAGVVPVMALPKHRSRELVWFAAKSRARLVIQSAYRGDAFAEFEALVRSEIPSVETILSDEGFAKSLDAESGLRRRVETSPSEVGLLQLSGGSTGLSKLIPRTSDDYLYSVRRSAEILRLGESTRFLAVLPLSHNFSLSSPGLLGVLHAGGTVVTLRDPSPSAVLGAILEHEINLLPAVPALARLWADTKATHFAEAKFPNLVLQVGGARLPESLAHRLVEEWGACLQQVFGMAEGLVCYTDLDASLEARTTTQGRPMSSFDEVRLVDPEVPGGIVEIPGEIGELWTRGPYTIRGYWDDADGDAHRFSDDGFYRTGDLVKRSALGDLTVVGRVGARINRAGEKIAPEELEEVLLKNSFVRDVVVYGEPDPLFGERAVARVVPSSPEMTPVLRDLKKHLRLAGLAEYKTIDRLEIATSLETTAIGKIDRGRRAVRLVETS